MTLKTIKPIIVGRIGRIYGVKGWLKVNSFTEPKDNILRYQPWLLNMKETWQELKVTESRKHGTSVVVHLSGCDDRDVARRYTNALIAIQRNQLPELKENEYYWADLEGLKVITLAGQTLGIVDSLFNTGANDILIVKGDKEHLIPFVLKQIVKDINLIDKTIVVDWDPDF